MKQDIVELIEMCPWRVEKDAIDVFEKQSLRSKYFCIGQWSPGDGKYRDCIMENCAPAHFRFKKR